MTTLLVQLHSGGSDVTGSGTYWPPYFIGGGILLVLLSLMVGLLAFGKGREHS